MPTKSGVIVYQPDILYPGRYWGYWSFRFKILEDFSSKNNCIVLEKITKTTVDLDEFLQQLEELDPDPNQPTLQEISQIVKEVRRELWSH